MRKCRINETAGRTKGVFRYAVLRPSGDVVMRNDLFSFLLGKCGIAGLVKAQIEVVLLELGCRRIKSCSIKIRRRFANSLEPIPRCVLAQFTSQSVQTHEHSNIA